MRNWIRVSALLSTLLLPLAASADFSLAVSAGKAIRLSPTMRGEPTTLMVAPGWGLAEKLLRAEVGLVAALPDLAGGGGRFDIQVRPGILVSPPLLPIHGRAFAVVDRIINGVRLLPGAALGLNFNLGDVGVFAEAGALPRFGGTEVEWLLEPRAGAVFFF